jgi:hypothetical protein
VDQELGFVGFVDVEVAMNCSELLGAQQSPKEKL